MWHQSNWFICYMDEGLISFKSSWSVNHLTSMWLKITKAIALETHEKKLESVVRGHIFPLAIYCYHHPPEKKTPSLFIFTFLYQRMKQNRKWEAFHLLVATMCPKIYKREEIEYPTLLYENISPSYFWTLVFLYSIIPPIFVKFHCIC